MKLTDAGWPRPKNDDGYPIPWYNDADDLRAVHGARYSACASGAICPICGVAFIDGMRAFAFLSLRQLEGTALADALTSSLEHPLDGFDVSPMDNSVMHDKCAKLSLARCPHLADLISAGDLFVIELPANACDVHGPDEHNRRTHGVVNGADCDVLNRP